MTEVIAIINQKGGVGKSTTCMNLAYSLSELGKKVLAIDFDSQASMTNALNIGLKEGEEYNSIYEVLDEELYEGRVNQDLIRKAIISPTYTTKEIVIDKDGTRRGKDVEKEFGFDLLPSHILIADYELDISQKPMKTKAFQLYNIIEEIKKIYNYDLILIDCPPSLGIMSVNAITAATSGVIIPTNLDLMSTRGVESLIEKIAEIQTHLLKYNLRHNGVIGILLNLFSERRIVDRTIRMNLEKFYPVVTFDAQIPESSKARSAVYAGRLYSQLYPKAKAAYDELAIQLLNQIELINSSEQKIIHLESKGKMIGSEE